MIPLQDVIPSRATPWLTLFCIAAIAIAFAAERAMPPLALREAVFDAVHAHGLSYGLWLAPTLLVHTGLIHAGTNAFALWLFGPTLEDRLGRSREAAILALGAVVSAAAVHWTHPDPLVPFTGAGGAVGALIGAYLALWPRSRLLALIPIPMYIDLVEIPAAIVPGFWFLLQVLAVAGPSALPSLAAADAAIAMLAGGLTGAAMAWLLLHAGRVRKDWSAGDVT